MVQDEVLEMDVQEEMQSRYLTFWIENQLFGVPITEVVQIIGMQEITELPESKNYTKGIISLRGQIIPVIDVRLRFGKPEAEHNERTCIIIMRVDENDFGFIVDEVDEVKSISSESISPAPQISQEKMNVFLSGIGQVQVTKEKEGIVMLLHTAKLLEKDEFDSLAKAAVQ